MYIISGSIFDDRTLVLFYDACDAFFAWTYITHLVMLLSGNFSMETIFASY